MKRFNFLFAAVLGFAACTSTTDKSADSADTSDDVNLQNEGVSGNSVTTLCFQKLAGTANQDTTSLKLNIEGEKVTGDFGHYPKEKDKRVGKIIATKDDELIRGVWIYMQEGMKDTLQVEFKLEGDKMVQKNYTINPKTGREVFSEASAFNIEFERVSCKD